MTPHTFMAAYFKDRTALILSEMERRLPHRRAYFASDCRWDSRSGAVESSEAERILDVSEADGGVLVVTTGSSANKIAFPLRYHLRRNGESWVIHQVETRCPCCSGSGKVQEDGVDCPLCKGRGWNA